MIPLKVRLAHLWQLRDSEIVFVVKMTVFILLTYGVVGSLDYADQKAQESERHQQRSAALEDQFLRCLNGGPVAETQSSVIVCDKAWEVRK